MKKFAKLLAMVLAVSMVLTMFVGAYSDEAKINPKKAAAVQTVYEAGIMMGNDKGEFNPTDTLTRDEMAKILFALASKDQKAADYFGIVASVTFADYDKIPGWSKAYVGYAASADYILGNDKGEANALGTLSYVEAAIMLMRTLNLEGTYDDGEDKGIPEFTGSKWYQNAVLAAYENDLFAGLDIVEYKAAITREDVAVMIANAIKLDTNGIYELAKPVTGVVIGTKTEEIEGKKVELFDILGLADKVAVEGYKVEEVVGHEINAVVEDNKAIVMEIAEPVFEDTVTLSDVAIKDLDDKDDKTVWSLVIGDKVVAADLSKVTARYIAKNSVKYAPIEGGLKSLLEGEQAKNGFQAASLIVNETSLFVTYAPYEIHEWNKALVAEEFKDGEWTGTWLYNNTYIVDEALKDLDNCLVAAQLIDNKVSIVGFPKDYKVTDLTVTYSAKDGKYVIKLDGETLVNATKDVEDVNFWQKTLTGDKGTIYVYDGRIVAYAPEKAADPTKPVYDFIFGTFVDATISVTVNPDEKAEANEKFLSTVTYYFKTIDGETRELVAEAEKSDAAGIITSVDLPTGFKCIIMKDGKFDACEDVTIGAKTVVTALDAEKIDGVEIKNIEKLMFVDASKTDVALASLKVEALKDVEGIYVATIDGVRVNKTNVVYSYTFSATAGEGEGAVTYDVVVVVYDPEGKFELQF